MKYKNSPIIQKNYSFVSFQKGDEEVTLKVSPLPMGHYNHMKKVGILEYHRPPMVPRSVNGVLVKGADKRVELFEDTDDPTYRDKTAVVHKRLTAVQFYYHLIEDTNIDWDVDPPSTESKEAWRAFADALVAELAESTLTDEEVSRVLSAGEETSLKVDDEAAREALQLPFDARRDQE